MCFLPSLREPLDHCALCSYYGTHSPIVSFAPPLGTFALPSGMCSPIALLALTTGCAHPSRPLPFLRVALNLCPFGLSLPSQILSPDLIYCPEGGSLDTMNKNKLGRSVLDPIALLVNKPGRSLLPFVTSELSARPVCRGLFTPGGCHTAAHWFCVSSFDWMVNFSTMSRVTLLALDVAF